MKFEAQLQNFESGQFVRIGLEVDDEVIARPYSLVNTPDDSVLEIYFNIVPEGPLSPRLFELQSGDDILVGIRPSGFLTLSEVPHSDNLWMLATGTAIGPFLSILKGETVWQRFDRIILCYSVSVAEELAYLDDIQKINLDHPAQFSFIPIVTREKTENALNERITQGIANGRLESIAATPLSAQHSHVMICGSSEMITDVSGQLESRGMRKHRRREPGHYTIEKYH